MSQLAGVRSKDLGLLGFCLLALFILAGCGSNGNAPRQEIPEVSSGKTEVKVKVGGIALTSNSTKQKSSAIPAQVASVALEVRIPGCDSPVIHSDVANVAGAESVSFDMELEAGSAGCFSAKAFSEADGKGTILFEGSTSGVNLLAGDRIIVEINLGIVGVTPPVVSTLPAGDVTATSAVLHGEATPNQFETVIFYDWGLNSKYGSRTPIQQVGAGKEPVPVRQLLNGLAPGTTYHYRLVGSNSGNRVFGEDQTFVTLAQVDADIIFPELPPPTITTGSATNVTESSAQLTGTVNPMGSTAHAYIEWGADLHYGNTTDLVDLGNINEAVSITATLTDLDATKTYHFRMVAYNAGGLTVGTDQTFTPTKRDANVVAPGTIGAEAGSSRWITVHSSFTGDANGNSFTRYEFGTSGSGPWTQVCGGTAGESFWRRCAFGELTPNTDYFVRVTFGDPDGVEGPNPQVVGPIHTSATSDDAVSVGTVGVSVSDTDIVLAVPISDDANMNSRVERVEIATSSSGPWTEKCGSFTFFAPKLCRIVGLTHNTDYFVRVTLSDPDGNKGSNPTVVGPIHYTGRTDLALGKPVSADPGWGCCPTPNQLTDGRIQYRDWFFGFSWTGGGKCWAGGCPTGFKQATIDLGSVQPVSRLDWWTHDPGNVPTNWKVLVSSDGTGFTEVFSTTAPRCRTETEPMIGAYWGFPACRHQADFSPVEARFVRYMFDDSNLFDGIHGWAVEIAVYGPQE